MSKNLLLIGFFILSLSVQGVAQLNTKSLVLDFDRTCMKKYEYQTDKNYIVESSHTNYHFKIDHEQTIVFKVYEQEDDGFNLSGINYEIISCGDDIALSKDDIILINSEAYHLFVMERIGNKNRIYKADHIIYINENTDGLVYFEPPYNSFQYTYDHNHDPGETIPAAVNESDEYDTKWLYHGETKENGQEVHAFLKMFRDVCYKRPWGITTELTGKGQDNPMKKVIEKRTGKPMFRSCQHAIQTEFIPGIGLYREFYEEGEKRFTSNLSTIDGMPIQSYLSLMSGGQYVAPVQKEQPVYAQRPTEEYNLELSPTDEFLAMANMKGAAKKKEVKKTVAKKVPVMINGTARKGSAEKRTFYVVEKGDTLYSLSRRFGTSVENIQALNDLEGTTIGIGQQLIMY